MNKLVYISAPYSHPDKLVRDERVERVATYAIRVYDSGNIPFSPVLHCIAIEHRCEVPGTYDYWERYCLETLKRADEVHVLKLDGWDQSVGVQAEMEFAFDRKIPMRLVAW